MAASLMSMLDNLEVRLERTQAELQALREENKRLKQQLELRNSSEPSAPSQVSAATAEPSIEAAPESDATDQVTTETETSVQQNLEQLEPEQTESEPEATAQQTPKAEQNKQEAAPVESAETARTNESAQAPSPYALLNQWYERYPKAFFKGHTKPLKIGIHQDLAEREEWSNKLIRRALANYVNLPRYIKAVRTGAERVDLDGQPAGKVDKEAALHASEKRGDKKESGQPKKAPSKPKPVASDSRPAAVEQAESKKSEPSKPLSLEDKLLGLQQKFKGR